MKTTLYRAYDEQGTLLYVGISSQVITRFDQHTQSSKWMQDCTNIRVEHFKTRNEALTAEKIAVKDESPIWNIVHKVDVA